MKKSAAVLALLLLAALSLRAQNTPAPAVLVNLGHSAVALTGPWKFHIGDNQQWSAPNFDDSKWETVDVGAKADSLDPSIGLKAFSPGWTAKGHPGYSGFAWYRIRIGITGADGPLSLLAPVNVDDSYQVYANGRLIGSLGNFDRPIPTIYNTRPVMFALPESADGTAVLAFRFYMAPRTLVLQQQSGGMHSSPVVGLASAITAAWHVAWEDQYRAICSAAVWGFVFFVAALLALMLYAFDRTESILLWPLAACVLNGAFLCIYFADAAAQWMPQLQASILNDVLLNLAMGFWLATWCAYFRLGSRKWLRNAVVALVLWRIATDLLFQFLLLGGHASRTVIAAFPVNSIAASWAELLLLALIAWFGFRRPQRESWMLFTALFFYAVAPAAPTLRLLPHLRTTWFPFGIILPISLIAYMASLFCFFFVLLGRFRSSQRRQQALIEDVKQAQEVQQVLIPEKLPQVPGFTIESEYRPAREVGGDFFQIIPYAEDGSVLIVAGDVTGKGLQAGMLVALIVGAIRAEAAHSSDPLAIIASLNERLCGRDNAHATCLALRIAADGSATLANAGHLPPWLNGKELLLEGALPLGMTPNADFSVMRFQLEPNGRLMLLSDGVAEAQNRHGQLFGFDRIRSMLQKPLTASAIAEAAQIFGQQDDISVLSVTLSPALKEAVA